MQKNSVLNLNEIFSLVSDLEHELKSSFGPKALIRKLGELLVKHFGVCKVSCYIIDRKLCLSEFGVKFDEASPISPDLASHITSLLQNSPIFKSQLREGACAFEFKGGLSRASLVPVTGYDEGVLLVWQGSSPLSELENHVIRFTQNEATWFTRLESQEKLLYQDDLTGLYNSRYLELAIDQELRRSGRSMNPFCLMFIDLDGFKAVNDQYGHPVGSQVLKQVAKVIKDAVREIDIPIRYGGDEFVVVLVGASSAKGLLAAERVRRNIERTSFKVDPQINVNLTASIGLSAYPDHARDRESLLKVADDTMYNSKKRGKNRVSILNKEGTLS